MNQEKPQISFNYVPVSEETKAIMQVYRDEFQKLFDKATYKGKPISNSQRYKMCGNAFNCAVIRHILLNLIKQ